MAALAEQLTYCGGGAWPVVSSLHTVRLGASPYARLVNSIFIGPRKSTRRRRRYLLTLGHPRTADIQNESLPVRRYKKTELCRL
jgi:hypothetical protein